MRPEAAHPRQQDDPETSMARRFQRIAFIASPTADAREAAALLMRRYDNVRPEDADVIVALGGDGLMLQALHRFMDGAKPIYGMNRGTVGFLMNEFREDGLVERLESAHRSVLHPLLMEAEDIEGRRHVARAVNEVYMLRQTHQTAKLRIAVDGHERLSELIADGVLCATPAGSTAYNLSVGGPILPLNAQLLALTPISAFRPRRWRGALLPSYARIRIEVIEPEHRPVAAVADHTEFRRVRRVETWLDQASDLVVLHDPGHSLDERILREQFG